MREVDSIWRNQYIGSMDKELVKKILFEKRAELELLGVKRIGLFGSFVRNEQRPSSDIDFLVEYYPGKKNFDSFMQVAFFLEDTFQRKIDLLTKESVSQYIYPHIEREIEYVSLVA